MNKQELYEKKVTEYKCKIKNGDFDDYLTEQQKKYLLWELRSNLPEFGYGVVTGMLITLGAKKVV